MPSSIWNVSWGAGCRGEGVHTEQCTHCVLRARLQWGLALQHGWVLLQTPWIHCSFNFDLVFSHSGAKKPGIITKVPMAPNHDSVESHELHFKEAGSSSRHPHREMYFFWFPSVFARLFPLLALQQFRVLGLSSSAAVPVFRLSHTVAVLKFSNLGI